MILIKETSSVFNGVHWVLDMTFACDSLGEWKQVENIMDICRCETLGGTSYSHYGATFNGEDVSHLFEENKTSLKIHCVCFYSENLSHIRSKIQLLCNKMAGDLFLSKNSFE